MILPNLQGAVIEDGRHLLLDLFYLKDTVKVGLTQRLRNPADETLVFLTFSFMHEELEKFYAKH